MTPESLSESHHPTLPYEYAKSIRVLAYIKDSKSYVFSEKQINRFIYQELSRYLLDDFEITVCSSSEFDQLLTKYYSSGEEDSSLNAELSENFDLQSFASTLAPTEDLLSERWSKLMVNCMANPLAGLTGWGTSKVRTEPLTQNIAIQIASEVVMVAKSEGYKLGKIMGMQPEDFELDQDGPIKIKVELVELIGANTLIHVKLENSNEILVASISGVVNEETIGKNINLSIQNDKLHLFDTNTDLRIN